MLKKFSFPILIIFILVQTAWSQSTFRKDYFRPPVDIDILLSGNFGELRSNHFHSGIDIKTQGVIGHRIYAAAEGYVSRIKIEAAGYGNTLYITHPAGYTTVYAHLNRFREDIAEFVKEKQYGNQQHALNIFPGREDFPVQKGEVVAFSGTSGYSFGPHLHFEIRNAGKQEPMNAMLFGLNIKDIVAPRIFSLYLYPGQGDFPANPSSGKTRLEVSGENGKYRLSNADTLRIKGPVGFGIEAFDYLNGARNRCGIYRIRILVDNELKYDWKMDQFSFSKARYINSYIDYEERLRNSKVVQKTFVEPNNKLPLYQYVENQGLIDFSENRTYQVKFLLEDAYENTSTLEFMVLGAPPEKAPEPGNGHAQEFLWSGPNEFIREDISFKIPAGGLYTNLKFNYEKLEKKNGAFSPTHCLHDLYTPIHLNCELGILPVGLPENLREKALIVTVDEKDEMSSAGGEWKDGMIRTQVREFGQFTIKIDTTPPVIRPMDLSGSTDTIRRKSIRFKVSDDMAGVKSYEGYIDNEWVLFEYDYKNDLVFYRFDPDRLGLGQSHELELYIIDNRRI